MADGGALQNPAAHSEQERGRKRGKTEPGPSMVLGGTRQEAYCGGDAANWRCGVRRRKLGFSARRLGEALLLKMESEERRGQPLLVMGAGSLGLRGKEEV